MVIKKRSATAQWMLEHPHDTPCPRDYAAAKAWRQARGIGLSYAEKAKRAEYERIMRERRCAIAGSSSRVRLSDGSAAVGGSAGIFLANWLVHVGEGGSVAK
jgi:hypothetical protein